MLQQDHIGSSRAAYIILILIIWVLLATRFFYRSYERQYAEEIMTWPTVDAQLLYCRAKEIRAHRQSPHWTMDVNYSFELDGQRYTSGTFSNLRQRLSQSEAFRLETHVYKPGMTVTVSYDPDNPEIAYLLPLVPSEFLDSFWFYFAAFLASLGLAFVMEQQRKVHVATKEFGDEELQVRKAKSKSSSGKEAAQKKETRQPKLQHQGNQTSWTMAVAQHDKQLTFELLSETESMKKAKEVGLAELELGDSELDDSYIIRSEHCDAFRTFIKSTPKLRPLLIALREATPANELTIRLTKKKFTLSLCGLVDNKTKEDFIELAEKIWQKLEAYLFDIKGALDRATHRGTLRMRTQQISLPEDETKEAIECNVFVKEHSTESFTARISAGTGHEKIREHFGTPSSIETGNTQFDDTFFVVTSNCEKTRTFLSPYIRTQLLELYEMGSVESLVCEIDGYRLTIVKTVNKGQSRLVEEVKRRARRLALQFIAPNEDEEDMSLEILEIGSAAEVSEDDAICQICGLALDETSVRCSSCNTMHHLECWHYLGSCSTYACGSKSYRL